MSRDKDWLFRQMDEAASEAREEIESDFSDWSAHEVARWWERWYLQAGHKRLGRILLRLIDAEDQSEDSDISDGDVLF